MEMALVTSKEKFQVICNKLWQLWTMGELWTILRTLVVVIESQDPPKALVKDQHIFGQQKIWHHLEGINLTNNF
jgi:hypothetical protein